MNIDNGSVINGKYTIEKILGKSTTSGTTALCSDENKRWCVVRLLNLEKPENWKKYDLFEREVSTLKNLKLDFKPHVNIKTGFKKFIDLLIEPDQENRILRKKAFQNLSENPMEEK